MRSWSATKLQSLPSGSGFIVPAPRRFESSRHANSVSAPVLSGHDFAQLAIHAAPIAFGGCPLSLASPRACPFGGACHNCPVLQRKETAGRELDSKSRPEVLATVHTVLQSPGQPLGPTERALFERGFGHDFSQVRVHTDAEASESAQSIRARAYTVNDEIVFGRGQYDPASTRGLRLMAHELAHVVQQQQAGGWQDPELHANAAADLVVRGQQAGRDVVGSASPGFYAQNEEEEPRQPSQPVRSQTLRLNWREIWSPGPLRLTPTPLSAPGSQVPPAALRPPPTTAAPQAGSETPELPSRLPVFNSGRFSLGLRLGFPDVEARQIPGAPPSALAEALRRAEFMNQMLTGQIPQGWEAVDKAQLARAIWGIFSTHIAPGLARNITNSLSTSTGPGGLSYQLDLVLLTDFSGGGLSFTIRY